MIQQKPGRLGGRWLFPCLAIVAMLAGVVQSAGGAWAQADSRCEAVPPPEIAPDLIAGVRTKWKFVAGDDHRHTIQPDLQGLPLKEWASLLESQGVNTVDLNLEPRETLKQDAAPSDQEVTAYADAIYGQRSEADDSIVAKFENTIIPDHEYTISQQQYLLERFLGEYERAFLSHEIDGRLKFIVHQRLWFRPGEQPDQVAMRQQRIEEFSADMSDLINRLRAHGCLDHWLTGIRLGENGNPHMDELMPVLSGIASRVNSETGDWLKSHLFLSNGGGMGAEYLDLAGFAQEGGVSRFFEEISRNTGAFAFGYKWMRYVPARHGFRPRDNNLQFMIRRQFEQSMCGDSSDHPCQDSSIKDWEGFLGQTLGFSQLKGMISEFHQQYPNHANVMFVGDNGDALINLTHLDNGKLTDDPAFVAMQKLWPVSEPGWCGRQFLNGFVDSSTARRATSRRGSTDDGLSMYFVDSTEHAVLQRQTIAEWRDFPCPMR